jgi:V/A-type H+-transporting ATPase subunit C
MSRRSRLDYAYAVGRVRALERYLVEQAVFREAAEASDFSAALKIIYDAGRYSEDLIKAQNSGDLDAVLFRETLALRREMTEILLDKEVLDAFLQDDEPEKALTAAERSGCSFLVDYTRHRIDLGNIKILCRAKYLGFPEEKLRARLLRGGRVEPKIFVDLYSLPFSEMCDRSEVSLYCELIMRGTDVLDERETFVVLENGIENFLMTYLRRAQRFTFGPEPVFGYGVGKKKELSLVRLLGVGKMTRLPADLLKERISETYV